MLDRERNVRVALKSLTGLDAEALGRFKETFRTIRELDHPNVGLVEDLIEHEGSWFYTMELVPGIDFLSYARGGTWSTGDDLEAPHDLDTQRLRRALVRLVEGVDALHRAGLVHGTLKPSNALVTPEGRVVVLDVGLAVPGPDGDERVLEPFPDARSDWYAVGAMLHEALTGQLPGEERGGSPGSPAHLPPDLPEDLERLRVDLLSADPGSRPDGPAILARLRERRAPGSRTTRAPVDEVFVGRVEELDRLGRSFAATLGGEAAIALVTGAPGVGKSALVRRFTDRIRADHPDVLVFAGRCYEHESIPYKALDGIMEQVVRWLEAAEPAIVEAVLPGDPGSLARAFPALQRLDVVARAPAGSVVPDSQALRSQVFAAVRSLFHRIASRAPAILVIDDLQWADADGLAILAEITRTPDPPPLLLVATRRTREPRSQPLATAWPGRTVEQLELDRLSLDEAGQLARRLLGTTAADPETLQTLVDESLGHPLFLASLVRHVTSGLAPGTRVDLDDALWAEIERLDLEAQRVLRLVALAGSLTHDVLVEAASIPGTELTHCVSRLRRTRLLRTTQARATESIEPYHDRIREVLVSRLPVHRARESHGRIARALERCGRAEPELGVRHWSGAGDRARAARCATAAGDRAAAALAFDRAASFYREARELGGSPDLDARELAIRLGDALAHAGRGAEAAEAYRTALAGSSGVQELDLRRRAAEQLLVSGRFEAGLVEASRYLARLGMSMPRPGLGALFELLVLRARLALRGRSFGTRDLRDIRPSELEAVDANWSLMRGISNHDGLRSQVFQSRGTLGALALGDPLRVGRSLGMEYANACIETPGWRARHERRLLATTARLAAEHDDPYLRAFVPFARAFAAYVAFCDWRECISKMAEAEELFEAGCVDVAWELTWCQDFPIDCLMWTGSWRQLAHRVSRSWRAAEDRGDLLRTWRVRGQHGVFHGLVLDDLDLATEHADHAFEQGATHSPISAWVETRGRALIDLYRGRGEDATRRLRRVRAQPVGWLLFRAPIMDFEHQELSMRAALLGLADTAPEARSEARLRVQRHVRRLRRFREPCGEASARLGLAVFAGLDGESDLAIARFEEGRGGAAGHRGAGAPGRLSLETGADGWEGTRASGSSRRRSDGSPRRAPATRRPWSASSSPTPRSARDPGPMRPVGPRRGPAPATRERRSYPAPPRRTRRWKPGSPSSSCGSPSGRATSPSRRRPCGLASSSVWDPGPSRVSTPWWPWRSSCRWRGSTSGTATRGPFSGPPWVPPRWPGSRPRS